MGLGAPGTPPPIFGHLLYLTRIPLWEKLAIADARKIGVGVTGAPRPIHPFLLSAQNYWDVNHKKYQNRKFLLNKPLPGKSPKFEMPITPKRSKSVFFLFFYFDLWDMPEK